MCCSKILEKQPLAFSNQLRILLLLYWKRETSSCSVQWNFVPANLVSQFPYRYRVCVLFVITKLAISFYAVNWQHLLLWLFFFWIFDRDVLSLSVSYKASLKLRRNCLEPHLMKVFKKTSIAKLNEKFPSLGRDFVDVYLTCILPVSISKNFMRFLSKFSRWVFSWNVLRFSDLSFL